MSLLDIISPQRIRCDVKAGSKKRVLEELSQILGSGDEAVAPRAIFDCLFARERLGSTGLGEGVALPHGRLAQLEQPIGAFLRTVEGVDFDAPDGGRVDLVFGLLVPEDSTEEHLELLSQLARVFSDEVLRDALRRSPSPEEVFARLTQFVSRASE